MKDRLTPEQSQRLIELGVNPNKASMCMLYFPESDSSEPLESWQMWEECGKLLCNPDESRVQDVECVIVPKSADYDLDAKEEHPIFNLTDILSLLPKEIKHKGDPYGLDINWDDSWSASYFNAVNFVIPNKEGSIAFEQAPELIDALFELLCWVLKNHPDKIKKL